MRGHHEKRLRQRVGFIAKRHLAFLHRFKQRALHLGGRAVDFVGQNEVAENGAVLGVERSFARIVNHRADDVGGQHVGRELQPLKLHLRGRRERFERERLRQAGHAFQKDVAVGDEADEQAVHEMFLANEDAADFLAQRRDPRGILAHGFVDGLDALVVPARCHVAGVIVLGRHRRCGPWQRCAAITDGFQFGFRRRRRRGGGERGVVIVTAVPGGGLFIPIRIAHRLFRFYFRCESVHVFALVLATSDHTPLTGRLREHYNFESFEGGNGTRKKWNREALSR